MVERPAATFRVGVTGDRTPALPVARLAERAAMVLRLVREEVERQSGADAASAVYAPGAPSLRLLSPLAEGADRILAQAALDEAGFALEVVLPFARGAYEATFQDSASVVAFGSLLEAAGSRVLTLDGAADDRNRAPSYGAAGRMVVRNCDLLVAIWDDAKPPRGRGGTSDTVHYALRSGVPVWCIHATRDDTPRLLTHVTELSHPLPNWERVSVPEDALRSYVGRVIRPPEVERRKNVPAWARCWIVRLWRLLPSDPDPLRALYAEHSRDHRRLWRTHDWAMGALRRHGRRRYRRREGLPPLERPARTAAKTISGPAWRRARQGALGLWRAMIAPVRRVEPRKGAGLLARLAGDYQHQYRTSYVFVLLCGALALGAAAVGLAFPAPEWVEAGATVMEAVALTIIFGLVWWNGIRRWHERYVSYRMLRELLRLQDVLHQLGWSLPGSRVDVLGRSARRGWVAWLFAALVRSVPLPSGSLVPGRVGSVKQSAIKQWLDDQLRYHEKRREECEGAGAILEACGKWLFWLTVVAVTAKLALALGAFGHASHRWTLGFGLLTVLLPTGSAAFFGIKAYEELESLAEQSKDMEEALKRAKTIIGGIDPERALASQVLGTELSEVATLMLSDVSGWAQLFRLKAVEA